MGASPTNGARNSFCLWSSRVASSLVDPTKTEVNPVVIRNTALDFIRNGWSPIPLPFKAKVPIMAGWQKLRINTAELVNEHFNCRPQNIGVLTGEPSSGLVDIDLDVPEALALARSLLPPTRTFGRKSNPSSHWLYRTEPIPRVIPFVFNGKKILEIRGSGGQSMFPPSIYPNGESIQWENEEQPLLIRLEDLDQRVSYVAAGALLARNWPSMIILALQ